MAHDPTHQSTVDGTDPVTETGPIEESDSTPENEQRPTDSSVVTPATSRSAPGNAHTVGDEPATCPVCNVAYDSVSVHDGGLMVNLLDNERYRRVCFEPVADADGHPLVRFFHHTHAQTSVPDPRTE